MPGSHRPPALIGRMAGSGILSPEEPAQAMRSFFPAFLALLWRTFVRDERESDEMRKHAAYLAGRQAFEEGRPRSDNPFPKKSYAYRAWRFGYNDACHAEMAVW